MYRNATRVSPAMSLAGLDGMMDLSLALLCRKGKHVVQSGLCRRLLRRQLCGHTVMNCGTSKINGDDQTDNCETRQQGPDVV